MRYWISWNQHSDDFRPMTVPDKSKSGILGYWCSGEGDGYYTMCAWVEADSQGSAEALIQKKDYWPDAGDWRFCTEVLDDWEPGPRFALERSGNR